MYHLPLTIRLLPLPIITVSSLPNVHSALVIITAPLPFPTLPNYNSTLVQFSIGHARATPEVITGMFSLHLSYYFLPSVSQ